MHKKSGTVMFVVIILLATLTQAASPRNSSQQKSRRFLGFDDGNQGVGLLLGQPTGVRYQQWTNWKQAIFYDVAYDWDKIILVGASYSFYFYNVDDLWKSNNSWNSFMFYIGGGGFGGIGLADADPNNKSQLGLRAYGGVEYLFSGGPWSIKAEVGPKVFLMGRTFAGVQGMFGITYYFDQDKKKKSETTLPEDEEKLEKPRAPVKKATKPDSSRFDDAELE